MKPAQNANAAMKWTLRVTFIRSGDASGSAYSIAGGFVMRKPVMKSTMIAMTISQWKMRRKGLKR